ncbi:Acetylcholinesterase [Acanthamoeba castellanii str. Neff]|uniref:Acetylcholinesterase n=1 Tax=Acanthamoeba castellanii (strain ATCC 30010 / Neff) TaxID=1257118 RepID=L8HB09_ACACF|nr:Acetylcholinesterase [Acanthamoeba castellanii str. Neff]ELR22689.1 Acetylcholinesterase [Acanthamoeba castellanii str. Neff]
MARSALFGAVVLLALLAVYATASPILVVPTESGSVQGFVQNDLARAFLGIPFANPPQRFGVATPASPWSGVYNATAFPKPCIQSSTAGVEDCLYLNVFTPKNAKAGDKLPVMGKPDSSEWPKYKKNRPVAFLWEQTDANLNPPTTTVPFFESNLCTNWEPIFSTNSVVQP